MKAITVTYEDGSSESWKGTGRVIETKLDSDPCPLPTQCHFVTATLDLWGVVDSPPEPAEQPAATGV